MTGQTSPTTAEQSALTINRRPWNRGRLIGQKPPLKLREVCAIRTRLQLADRPRATVLQTKTGRPVQFEIMEQTRSAVRIGLRGPTGSRATTSSPAASGKTSHWAPDTTPDWWTVG